MDKVESFLKELRDSADIMLTIFTDGSCFHLYMILKTIYPESIPYWSDRDNHCIIKINDSFYDIGGNINIEYIEGQGYYMIPENQYKGYSLLKYLDKENATSVKVAKYKTNG